MKMMEMVQFMKDFALMGSALMFLAVSQPWPLSFGNQSVKQNTILSHNIGRVSDPTYKFTAAWSGQSMRSSASPNAMSMYAQ